MRAYETARRVMITAHSIRRAAAIRFSCRISEIHWGECLRMAWAGVKAEIKNSSIVDTIRTFTKSWMKPGTSEERLYIDEAKAAAFIGLEVLSYKSGSIKAAKLNGEDISNNAANKIFFSMGKAYYDVTRAQWFTCFGDKALKLILEKLSA